MTIHHRATTADIVGGIGGLLLEFRLVRRLATRRFTRQVRLIDPHGDGLYQASVGRHLVSRVEHYDIAHHHILALDALDFAATKHRHHLLIFSLVQDLELLVGALLKQETHRGGQHHRHEDAQRLKQHRSGFGARKQLV